MNFKKGISPNQEVLLPKKASDFLPDNHLAKLIYLIVDKLCLISIVDKYSKIGQNAYHPKMMIRLLFYHYSIGICSSRKISNSCYERLDTKYLADGLNPSHDRIADFRKENLEELKNLFCQIVLIGHELGLINLNNINVSIDGSKFKAHASSKLSKTEDEFKKLLKQTEKEIFSLLEKAEIIDTYENRNDSKNEILKKLKSKRSKEIAIQKAMLKVKQKKDLLKHKYMEEKKKKPKKPNSKGKMKPLKLTKTELKNIDNQKINITDNEAKFMKQRNGLIKPAYNCQVSVDEKEQFIVSNDVTDECNDQHQLILMILKTIKDGNCTINSVKGDNGYFSELDIASRLFPEINLFIDDTNRRKNEIDFENIKEKYSKEELENLYKLLSKEGEEEYKKRMFTVEPVFGNIKENTGIKTFLLRGLSNAQGEFNLMCIGHNLKKISKYINKNGINIAIAMQKVHKKQKKIEIEVQVETFFSCFAKIYLAQK